MSMFGSNPFDQQKKIDGVKNIIAVGAGKGGVGKSTVSANLSYALSKLGKKVGLLDADIYGPSIPRMLGLEGMRPNVTVEKKIEPLVSFGIKTMSIGYLVDEKSAVIWRGPMLFKAIEQFIRDVSWGELDYLIVDLPPGTGDIQLSFAQKVPLRGAIIVSTPQNISLLDVKRCTDMFKRLSVPILGLVENMATFICPHCSKPSDLFSPGELNRFCEEEKIKLLAKIPFNQEIGRSAEAGKLYESLEFSQLAGVITSAELT
jgi:ATP-binding protein involved in chromosome partitioning